MSWVTLLFSKGNFALEKDQISGLQNNGSQFTERIFFAQYDTSNGWVLWGIYIICK